MNQLGLRLIDKVEDFEALRPAWNSVLDRSCDKNIFLTWEWQFTWWKHFGQGKRLNILVVEEDGRVVAIAPLMRTHIGFGPLRVEALENISNDVGDYGGLILGEGDNEAVQLLANYFGSQISKKNTVVTISRVPEETKLVSSLPERALAAKEAFSCYERPAFVCPYLAITSSYDAHIAALPRKRRGNLHRTMRDLSRDHKVCFRNHSNGQLREDMEVLCRLHNDRWTNKKDEQKGLLSDRKRQTFLLDVANALNRNGWLRLSFLMADDDLVSAVLGFEYGGRFYYFKPAFNPDYARYSPGHLHIMHLLEQSISNGVTEFDFLRGDEPYKMLWANSTREVKTLCLTKSGAVGKAHANFIRLARKLQRTAGRTGT